MTPSRYDDELWELVPDDPGPPASQLAEFVRSLGRVERALDLGCGDGRLTALLDGALLDATLLALTTVVAWRSGGLAGGDARRGCPPGRGGDTGPMSRSRLPVLLVSMGALLVLGASPAHAQAVAVLDELQRDGVAVEPGVQTPVDEAAVEDAVEASSVTTYVAVVTARTAADAGGAYFFFGSSATADRTASMRSRSSLLTVAARSSTSKICPISSMNSSEDSTEPFLYASSSSGVTLSGFA